MNDRGEEAETAIRRDALRSMQRWVDPHARSRSRRSRRSFTRVKNDVSSRSGMAVAAANQHSGWSGHPAAPSPAVGIVARPRYSRLGPALATSSGQPLAYSLKFSMKRAARPS